MYNCRVDDNHDNISVFIVKTVGLYIHLGECDT